MMVEFKKLLVLGTLIVGASLLAACQAGDEPATTPADTAASVQPLSVQTEVPESAAPQLEVHASAQDNVHIALEWEAVAEASGYVVSRTAADGAYEEIATLEPGTTAYTDMFLDTGVTYTYLVQANGTELEGVSEAVALPLYTGMFNDADGVLYGYVDGSLLRDTELDGFTFDAEGRYTTGDAELDNYLRTLTAANTTPEMTQLEKFRALYDWVIANSTYRAREQMDSDPGWEVAAALDMFQQQSGNCYSYAAAVAMLGRNVGLQTRSVIGQVHQTYQWVDHGWTEVTYEGTVYLCDAEMEGVFATNRDWTWDLFMKEYGTTPTQYDEY